MHKHRATYCHLLVLWGRAVVFGTLAATAALAHIDPWRLLPIAGH